MLREFNSDTHVLFRMKGSECHVAVLNETYEFLYSIAKNIEFTKLAPEITVWVWLLEFKNERYYYLENDLGVEIPANQLELPYL